MDYAESFRLVVGIILLLTWYVVSRRTYPHWKRMTRVGRRLWLGYYGLLFTVIWGTIEQMESDASITSKNYVLAGAAAFLLVAGLLRLDGDESTEPVYRVHLKGSPTGWYIHKLR